MAEAVCMRCGAAKTAGFEVCEACGFVPTGPDEVLKSMYLSTQRFAAQPARQAEYALQLDVIGDRLARGEPVRYEPGELARLRQFLDFDDPVPRWRPILLMLWILFRPAIAFLALGGLALALLRACLPT